MRIIPALPILCLALCFSHELSAQNCGCADQGNCEFSFGASTSTQVCYDITDAYNNDLSNPDQGVCGVYIKFRQGLIGDLNLTLISPDGTEVQLVGSSGFCNCSTPVAIWDILFVSDPADSHPDTTSSCPMPNVFDGCPNTCIPNCWPNGYFTGSYLPFSGSLSDFNSGSANGQWCVRIDNEAQFNTGKIFDFQVFLCDQSGILCCDADAGLINTTDFSACLGDEELLLSPKPGYGALRPDTAEYGYTFAIFENNNPALIALETAPDLRAYPTGTYQVCGLSYRYADTLDMPIAGTPWTHQALYDTLTGPNPPFCGKIQQDCIDVTIYAPPLPVNLIDTICINDSVQIGDSTFNQSGQYAVMLQSLGGCDSLVNLELTVLPVDTTNLQATLCPGEFFVIANDTFSTTGMHSVFLENKYGCDSIVLLDLVILPPIENSLTEMICSGDTVWVGSTPYTTTGVYANTLTSFFNCDSLVTLDLFVIEVSVSIAEPDTLTCLQTAVSLEAAATTNLGVPDYLWSNNATTQNISVSLPGVYSVTASAAGCSAAEAVTVFQNADPPNAIILNSPADTLTCSLSSIHLDGSSSNTANGAVQFSWTALGGSSVGNDTLSAIEVSEPDTYELLVTDPVNGCADTAGFTVFQNTVPPVANAGNDDVLSCQMPVIALDGTGSTPAGMLAYQWSTADGHFVPTSDTSNPIVSIDEAGFYYLSVTNLSNDCVHIDSVLIEPDTVGPHIYMLLPQGDTLTCALEELTLDAGTSVTNPNVVIQWAGNVAPTADPLVVAVNAPGTFSLTMTDQVNGCSDTEIVTVGIDTLAPVADAGADHTITCMSINSFTLGGAGTSSGSEFSYQWICSPGGNFTYVTDSLFTIANAEGTYYLTVTNQNNGCTAVDSTQIFDEANFPQADAGSDQMLNCQDTVVALTAATDPVVTNYIWKDETGNVLASGFNAITLTVSSPGIYVLTISNLLCQSSDTIQVTENIQAPVADAGSGVSLDCATGLATIDGSGSSVGAEYSYLWTTVGGHFVAGSNTLSPVVDKAGVYILEATNEISKCTATDTVLVSLDTAACMPIVNAGADGVLNCYNQLTGDTLAASGSIGSNFSHYWTAISGTIIDDSNPFAPIATQGVFVFTITNTAVGLTAADTVEVLLETTPPIADAGPTTQFLDCPSLDQCYPLDLSNTTQGAGIIYSWEVPGTSGSLCTAPDILNAEIKGEGFYELTVTDTNNGCSAFTTILIQLNGTKPFANAGANIQMDCGDTETLLNGNGSSSGANFSYEWFSFGGNVLNNSDTTTPGVSPNNMTDTFYLVVLNNINLCRDTDDVVVFAPVNCAPVCAAGVSGQLDCHTQSVTLSGNGSSLGADISYQWSTANGTLCGGETTPTACAAAAGTYQLKVTRNYPNGAAFDAVCEVEVLQNTQPPTASAGPDRNLTCVDTMLVLNGGASSSGAGFSYLWTSADGNILSGETTLSPGINATGEYHLLVADTANGCTATDFMLVGLDTLHPTAEAGPGDQLTCSHTTTILSGSGAPANVVFKWTSSNPNNGGIITGSGTPTPTIGGAGTYYLTVTIPTNGCTAVDSTAVSKDGSVPDINAGPSFDYTCADTIFSLQATAGGNAPLSFQWTAYSGGCFSDSTDVLQPTVACPGAYQLVATDLTNGCTAVSQTEVFDLTAPPVANAGGAQEINCDQFIVTLDGGGSSPAGQLDFFWSTLDGHLLSGETTATPQADSVGLYQLIVTNQQTQCQDTASVAVTIDANIPPITAGPDSTLTCTRTSLRLNGSGSATGLGITYTWTTTDGHIVNGGNTLTPLIDQPGIYILTIEDVSNQCIVQDSAVVTQDIAAPSPVIYPNENLILTCVNTQLAIQGDSSEPSGYLLFKWNTQNGHILEGGNSANVTIDSGGIYALTVTNTGNGCTASASVTIHEDFNKPQIQFASAPELNCYYPEAAIQVLPPGPAGDFTYQWTGPQPILHADSSTAIANQAGTYFIALTNLSNGCTNEDSIVVKADFNPPDAAATTLVQLSCENELALVSGKGSSIGNVSYHWSTLNGGNISDPNQVETGVDAQGWYLLTVTNQSNGCQAVDSTEVIALSAPIENAEITLESPNCTNPDGYISIGQIIGGAPPFSFSLNGGNPVSHPGFSYLDVGKYEIFIRDANGCTWSQTVEIQDFSDIEVDLGEDIIISQGEQANLSAVINFSPDLIDTVYWQNLGDSALCPQCLSQVVKPEKTTTYRIFIFDKNGCMATGRVTVFVEEARTFFVPTAFSPNEDGINDRLEIFAGPEVVHIHSFRIFDRWGNMVFQARDFPPGDPVASWDGRFEGAGLNPAVFVWMAELEFLHGYREVFYGETLLTK